MRCSAPSPRSSSAGARYLRSPGSRAGAPAARHGGRRPQTCRRQSSRCCRPRPRRYVGPRSSLLPPISPGFDSRIRRWIAIPTSPWLDRLRLVTVIAHRYVFPGQEMRQERTMGLLDVLNGMQNGPRGPSNPGAQTGGGMSPMTMAILALLAYKAVKHFGGSEPNAAPSPAPSRGSTVNAALPSGGMGGGLGDLLKGGLGGLLAGGAAGSVISGGRGAPLNQIPHNDHSATRTS